METHPSVNSEIRPSTRFKVVWGNRLFEDQWLFERAGGFWIWDNRKQQAGPRWEVDGGAAAINSGKLAKQMSWHRLLTGEDFVIYPDSYET